MSFDPNSNFYEDLRVRAETQRIKIRELFDYLEDGFLTKDELSSLLSTLMNPTNYVKQEIYEIHGHPVTKERFDEYYRHVND